VGSLAWRARPPAPPNFSPAARLGQPVLARLGVVAREEWGAKVQPWGARELMTSTSDFDHLALLYTDADEFMAGTRKFIEAGIAAHEPVLVAVPGAKIAPMRAMLNGGGDRVDFLNMNELGRNPGRIIPAVLEWVDSQAGGHCWFVGEPIWPGRRIAEIAEATRHEALINLAFAGAPVAILCPYDATRLAPSVLEDAERTHPRLVCSVDGFASDQYTDPVDLWQAHNWPLVDPAQALVTVPLSADLAGLREVTAFHVRRAGVNRDRSMDLILAVNEAATNALLHGGNEGELRIWTDDREVVCEVTDNGTFHEPLAGRQRPEPDWVSGRGVWLMNQLCDLVELRPTDTGTVVRLHVELGT
jgi:anti-sigma regulatory factor (Ser/Thr protein kinase)